MMEFRGMGMRCSGSLLRRAPAATRISSNSSSAHIQFRAFAAAAPMRKKPVPKGSSSFDVFCRVFGLAGLETAV